MDTPPLPESALGRRLNESTTVEEFIDIVKGMADSQTTPERLSFHEIAGCLLFLAPFAPEPAHFDSEAFQAVSALSSEKVSPFFELCLQYGFLREGLLLPLSPIQATTPSPLDAQKKRSRLFFYDLLRRVLSSPPPEEPSSEVSPVSRVERWVVLPTEVKFHLTRLFQEFERKGADFPLRIPEETF